jgi:hypothetical protein
VHSTSKPLVNTVASHTAFADEVQGELPARHDRVSESPGRAPEEFPERDQVFEADAQMIDDFGRVFFLVLTVRADKIHLNR